MQTVTQFMDREFKHFNARETRDAARGWRDLLNEGGEMVLAMAGAMSSAEIGISLARMIREDKVQAISCTAANLEEDMFNLFGHRDYEMVPGYRDLDPSDEEALRDRGYNRVTDTCIPENVMHETERILIEMWRAAAESGAPRFPWEFVYDLLRQPGVDDAFHIPPEHSWVLAAGEKGIPIYTPGWEDSTWGNMFCAKVMTGDIPSHGAIRSGTEQMQHLAEWYLDRSERGTPVGFFQIGGGIAGDFPICVVPMLIQDLKKTVPYWAYFAQISDSTTSYGSYSGAVPNEKITWHKLAANTPRYMINSDATIVAPLVFSYVLDG